MAIAAPSILTFPATPYLQGEAVDSVGVPFENQTAGSPRLFLLAANDNAPRSARPAARRRVLIPGWPMLEVEEEAQVQEPSRRPSFAPGW